MYTRLLKTFAVISGIGVGYKLLTHSLNETQTNKPSYYKCTASYTIVPGYYPSSTEKSAAYKRTSIPCAVAMNEWKNLRSSDVEKSLKIYSLNPDEQKNYNNIEVKDLNIEYQATNSSEKQVLKSKWNSFNTFDAHISLIEMQSFARCRYLYSEQIQNSKSYRDANHQCFAFESRNILNTNNKFSLLQYPSSMKDAFKLDHSCQVSYKVHIDNYLKEPTVYKADYVPCKQFKEEFDKFPDRTWLPHMEIYASRFGIFRKPIFIFNPEISGVNIQRHEAKDLVDEALRRTVRN